MQTIPKTTNTPKQHITKKSVQKETKDRLTRVDAELADGFNLIEQYDKTVTIFGSARFKEGNKYYDLARETAQNIAEAGYAVSTGGAGGIMEAGNRGAKEVGGDSLGFNIQLPHEQVLNEHTTENLSFRYFFTRKVILAYGASAYVFFPGGFGTMDEFFEVLTLIQTKKAPSAPMILVGSEFWSGLDDYIKAAMLGGAETISAGDENLYTITDDPKEVVRLINQSVESAKV